MEFYPEFRFIAMIELTFFFLAIQAVLSINIKSQIRKLLVLNSQSFSGSFICLAYRCFESWMKYMKYMRNKMQDPTFADIEFSNFSSFIFKLNHVFMEENENLEEKFIVGEEELDGIAIDGILNSENLPVYRWRILESKSSRRWLRRLTRNINKKRKPEVLQAYKCPFWDMCWRHVYFFNKHVKYSESG